MPQYCIRFLSLFAIVFTTSANATPPVQDGDIIFHTSQSAQSTAIQKATHSRYSHMGIIFLIDGKPMVFEAVSTVKLTPLDAWVTRGAKNHFVVKRLKAQLKEADVEKLKNTIPVYQGRPYDLTFEWSDARIYCSELVWKLYDRALGIQIGKLAKLKDFDLTSPIVQKKISERFGKNPPLDELVISPDAMFESPLLAEVAKG